MKTTKLIKDGECIAEINGWNKSIGNFNELIHKNAPCSVHYCEDGKVITVHNYKYHGDE